MGVHVAVVKGVYVGKILSGEKVAECRLGKRRGGPFGKVAPGDVIYFKASGGAFFCRAVVEWVWLESGEGGVDVEGIRERFGEAICGAGDFWEKAEVMGAKYGTVMGFGEVEEVEEGPMYERRYMGAWYVLGDEVEG